MTRTVLRVYTYPYGGVGSETVTLYYYICVFFKDLIKLYLKKTMSMAL